MVVKKKTKSRTKLSVKKKTTVKKAVRKAPVKKTPATKKAAVKKTTVKKAVVKKPAKKAVVKKAVKKVKKTTTRKPSGLTKLAYALSEELQSVVGAKSLTRPEVVKRLWAYIKAQKCQDLKNRRLIVPDAKLAKVIGTKPVDMMKLAGLLSKHIK